MNHWLKKMFITASVCYASLAGASETAWPQPEMKDQIQAQGTYAYVQLKSIASLCSFSDRAILDSNQNCLTLDHWRTVNGFPLAVKGQTVSESLLPLLTMLKAARLNCTSTSSQDSCIKKAKLWARTERDLILKSKDPSSFFQNKVREWEF